MPAAGCVMAPRRTCAPSLFSVCPTEDCRRLPSSLGDTRFSLPGLMALVGLPFHFIEFSQEEPQSLWLLPLAARDAGNQAMETLRLSLCTTVV